MEARLFDYINDIKKPTKEQIKNILDALNERYEDLEAKEPFSESAIMRWEEKLGELRDICNELEEMYDADKVITEQDFNFLVRDLRFFQFEYSGLKRVKIYY